MSQHGRESDKQLKVYMQFKTIGVGDKYKMGSGVYISPLPVDFSLDDFVTVRPCYCSIFHKLENTDCKECSGLVDFARQVQDRGIVELASTYQACFPHLKYRSEQAVRKLMQIPVAVVQMKLGNAGSQKLFAIENVPDLNAQRFKALAQTLLPKPSPNSGITKATLRDLCKLASTESDRLLIKYVCCKGQNLSNKNASSLYGFSNFHQQESKIMTAVNEIKELQEAVNALAEIDDKILLQGFGIALSDDESGKSGDESGDSALCSEVDDVECIWISDSEEDEFGEEGTKQEYGNDLLEVTDSESDNPDDYVSDDIINKIKKQRKLIRRRKKRFFTVKKTEQRLLKRKVPRAVSRILTKFPNIGKDMEEFVKSHKVGADAWRRTGALTFDGNSKVGPKVTYKRIQEYLNKKYNTSIGYGTVVQLCVVRNKRRLSAVRYKGAARITCRRSRKGFTVRMNPDAHWSSGLYRGLNFLLSKDGRNKVILNRDDAASFRLDTTYTHKQHKGLQLTNSPDLTTRTDYVNKYTSLLQTTSYLFEETETTPKTCVGVVKPHIVYEKSPCQHMADLNMLQKKEDISHVFNCEGPKNIWLVMVDGAGDEGPVHLEVAFLWTEKHLKESHCFTSITSRHSGGSYLNPVELMNGCLALAHSNMFIPSTLGGPVHGVDGINQDQLKVNLDLAADIYISRVQGAPCGSAKIKLVKGACDDETKVLLQRRPFLLTFLHGKAKEKEALKHQQPEIYHQFEKVWKVLENHSRKDIPRKYGLVLELCYKPDCPHLICASGKTTEEKLWFTGGVSHSR